MATFTPANGVASIVSGENAASSTKPPYKTR
jgi:hypothetical protein